MLRPLSCLLLAALLQFTASCAATPEFPQSTTTAPTLPLLHEPPFNGSNLTLRLPGEAGNAFLAAGGRFLIIHMKNLQSVAIVDLCDDRVAKILDISAAGTKDVHIAAGLNKLFVSSAENNFLARYSLDTFEKELTALAPEDGIQWMAMGFASPGPLFVASGKKSLMLNPLTLKPEPLQWNHWGGGNFNAPNMRVSGDGRAVVAWDGGWAGIESVIIQNNRILDHHEGGYIMNASLRPTFDGALIFGGDNSAFRNDVTGADLQLDGYPLPAAAPQYFLTLKGPGGKNAELKIYLVGNRSAVWTLKGFEELTESSLPLEERLFFIPQANLLAILGPGNDRLTLRRLNIIDSLNDAGIDYLLVTSNPLTLAEPGKTYRYQLQIASKRGNPACTLATGPQGMTISREGLLTWHVPPKNPPADPRIIISIHDASGQEIFHTFTLHLQSPPTSR